VDSLIEHLLQWSPGNNKPYLAGYSQARGGQQSDMFQLGCFARRLLIFNQKDDLKKKKTYACLPRVPQLATGCWVESCSKMKPFTCLVSFSAPFQEPFQPVYLLTRGIHTGLGMAETCCQTDPSSREGQGHNVRETNELSGDMIFSD
jgi:hypothetical protein